MLYGEFFEKYVVPFQNGAQFIFNHKGYIVYRLGTGGNLEILHLRAFETGRGHGPDLIRNMINVVEALGPKPYYSIFGFMLSTNEPVIKMYKKMGFETAEIPGLYKHNKAIMIFQDYDIIKKYLLGV